MWSVGILTYELLFGRVPFEITTERDFIKIVIFILINKGWGRNQILKGNKGERCSEIVHFDMPEERSKRQVHSSRVTGTSFHYKPGDSFNCRDVLTI